MSTQNSLKVALLIVSETASLDPSTDKTALVLRQVFENAGAQWTVVDSAIVPDDVVAVQRKIQQWTDDDKAISLIITSGGTGFAIKDVTPEAVLPVLHRQAPGLVHAMLSASLAVTPFAMMSRPVAGVRHKTIILTLPGSPKGAKENLESVIKLLPHACVQAAGADSRLIHAGGVKKLERDAGIGSINAVQKAGDGGSQVDSHHHHHHHHVHSHAHGGNAGTGHQVPVAHTKPEDRPPASNDPHAGPSRRYRESPYPMLTVQEALRLISEKTPPPMTTKRPVDQELVGYVLATDVQAVESVPAFRASIVDGYAIHIPPSGTFTKGTYPVSQISHAQATTVPDLDKSTIARITTGAPLPPGASAVVMVEDTVLVSQTDDGKEEKEVEILTSEVKNGENVREIGSDVQAGTRILKKGQGIAVGELGLLASVGVQEVQVFTKPVIGVLSTGDEIVEASTARPLKLGEVRDTNRPTLLVSVRSAGFEAVDLGIASDEPGTLESTLRTALKRCTHIITSGGVSMGELDLLKPTIERSLGGTIHFGRVSMKPGKPTTFATVPVKDAESGSSRWQDRVIFGLPGNPASAIVTFNLFVLPSLHAASGVTPVGLPQVSVVVDEDIRFDKSRAEYHRCTVFASKDGKLHAVSTGGQRSSRVGSFNNSNGLLCLPAAKEAGQDGIRKGEICQAMLVSKLLSDFESSR